MRPPTVEYGPGEVSWYRSSRARQVVVSLLVAAALIALTSVTRQAWRKYQAERLELQRQLDGQLIVAAFRADEDKVRTLLGAGANPNARYGKGGQSAFMSSSGGWPMMAHNWTSLLALADNHETPDGVEVAKLLVEAGADVNVDDGCGGTPLNRAVYANKEGVALYLIERGADVNAKVGVYIDGPGGVTALHRASYSSRLVRALLKGGADPNVPTSGGDTPLHWALRDCGAPRMISLLEGKTALAENSVAKRRAAEALESVKAMIEAGADVNFKNREGWMPLNHVEYSEAQSRLLRPGGDGGHRLNEAQLKKMYEELNRDARTEEEKEAAQLLRAAGAKDG